MTGCTVAAVRSLLRELSLVPGVRSVGWGSPGLGGTAYVRGRREFERERARPARDFPCARCGTGPVLEVGFDLRCSVDPARVARWHAVLTALLAPEHGGRGAAPSATRLHDAAQVLTRAQLDLATAAGAPVSRVHAALAECARLLSTGDAPVEPTAERRHLAPLVAEEVRRAQAVDRRRLPPRVELDVPADLECSVPGTLLRRVLRNLIVNALQASPDGAEVRVTARTVAGHVEVEVADAGRGLLAAERARLFESGPERVRGTGLGTRSIVEGAAALGAALAVASAPGRGTAIRLRWPEREQRPVVAVLAAFPRDRERIRAEWEARGWRVVAAGDPARLLGQVETLAFRRLVLARGTAVRTDDRAFVRLVERAPECAFA